jgi:hypothetical protein
MAEITLSTGKKIGIRQKKGQHHFIERKLLATCGGEGGQNMGGIMSTIAIQTIVGIESIDGKEVNVPHDEAGIFELMDQFTYEEWDELERNSLPANLKKKIEESAKNSQTSTGSDNESN